MNPKLHRTITENALQLFLEFSPPEYREVLGTHGQQVVRGSDLEDWWPPLTRLRNWHFFPSSPEIENSWINRTSGPRLAMLCDRLAARRDAGDQAGAARLFGRILHHIQDMSCPAHVVPIYHASYLWFNRPDSFEDHFVLCTSAHVCKLTREAFNGILTPALPGFGAIYQQAAQLTLEFVRENQISAKVDDKPTTLPLTFFFLPPGNKGPVCLQKRLRSRHAGFGNYGRLCNTFGQCCFTMNAYSYEVGPLEYQRIYQHFYSKAVADSIRAMAFFATRRQC